MDGNEYHDQKGHFTTKENDGGRCFHEGLLSRKSEAKRKEYLAEQGFEKERYNRKVYYFKEVGSYKDKFGNKHPIFMIYGNGKIFYSDNSIVDIDGNNVLDTFDKVMKEQKQKYDFNSALKKFDYLKEEDPQKYEEIKQKLEKRAREKYSSYFPSSLSDNDLIFSQNIEPKNDVLKKAMEYDMWGMSGLRDVVKPNERHLEGVVDKNNFMMRVFPNADYSGEGKNHLRAQGKTEEEIFQKLKSQAKELIDEYERKTKKDLAYQGKISSDLVEKYLKFDYDPSENFSDDKITEGTRVGGYSGYSKSNSAVASENRGSMPMSHWTKERILEYLNDVEELQPFSETFHNMPLKKLKEMVLYHDGWHHTGKFYNQTDYYGIESPRQIVSNLQWDRYRFDEGLKKGFED